MSYTIFGLGHNVLYSKNVGTAPVFLKTQQSCLKFGPTVGPTQKLSATQALQRTKMRHFILTSLDF